MNTLNQKANCKANKNTIKNYMGAQTRCLGTQSNEFQGILEYNNTTEGGEEMTTKEVARLVAWLKKEGYTLEDIEQLLKYIAGLIEIDFD